MHGTVRKKSGFAVFVAGARNVLKVGIGALHLYDQQPRGEGKNAVHHLGIQVVGIDELYERMKAAGLHTLRPAARSNSASE